MALLMLGAYRRAAATSVVSLVLDPAVDRGGGDRRRHSERPRSSAASFIVDDFARFMKILAYAGSAFAIVMSLDYLAKARQQTFEYPILILLSTVGMGMLISAGDLIALYLGLELMSLALYVVAASNRDSVQIDRGRPEVFRARRAVVGDAALRLLADLRLHRQRVVRRHRQGVGAGRHRADFRPRVPVRRLLLQGVGGAVPHVDAGRLRGRADAGHGVLRGRAQDRRDGDLRPRHHHRIPRHRPAMAADRGVRRDRLDGARRLRRHRPAQHQAADGLFVDRPHGLCAHRTRRRHRRRHPGRAGLSWRSTWP